MSNQKLVIKFSNATSADANMLASSLMERILDVAPGVEIDRIRERSDSQDFGTILTLMLGTAAAEIVARGISSWLKRNSGARIEVVHNGVTILRASNVDSGDVASIVAALSGNSQDGVENC